MNISILPTAIFARDLDITDSRILHLLKSFLNGDGDGQPYNENYDPIAFAYTYPINGLTEPVAELSFGQFATYIQDEYSVLDNLESNRRFTYRYSDVP